MLPDAIDSEANAENGRLFHGINNPYSRGVGAMILSDKTKNVNLKHA